MTVAVAGICQSSSVFVTASDRMATWGSGSADGSLIKAARLAPGWIAMIAGDDITRGVEDVIRLVRATLREYGDTHTVETVRATVMAAWRDIQNQRGAAVVLNPFSMDVPRFMRVGPKKFTPDVFARLCERLQVESLLTAQLLICGFDKNQIPAIVVCDDSNPWHEFTRAAFSAIGSGDHFAIGSMVAHGYRRENDLHDAIYQVCAAKFAAESDRNVGRDTIVVCFRDDGRSCWITPRNADWIRRLWESHGPTSIPKKSLLKKVLDPLIAESRWTDI